MFINLSNHKSELWSKVQKDAALKYGAIVDMPFPSVSPDATEEDITDMAADIVKCIKEMQPDVVMCQGEFTLSYAIISRCIEYGIKCVAACSERVVEEHLNDDGQTEKIALFKFVKFRQYI